MISSASSPAGPVVSPSVKAMIVAAILGLTAVAVITTQATGARGPSADGSLFLYAAECGPCDFSACVASQCDPIGSPFICTEGKAARGCAADSQAWTASALCETCCSVEECAETIAAGGEIEGMCEPCGESDCEIFGGYQRCGNDAPYVCTSGSACFGCSGDKYHWPAMEMTMCSSCCDMTSCT
jgi:hypothetical protein